MKKINRRLLLTLLATATLFVASCGEQATQAPEIQTAVALTVVAKNAEQNATATPSAAPEPTQTQLSFSPTLTPLAPVASPTAALNTTSNDCAKASLVSETVVDGTIFKPGEKFTKTWEIKNTSTCTWSTDYKIIFWSGDVLGGSYVYNLPQIVPPQGVTPISLILTAPLTDGDYTSKWALQTPDKTNFGVGEYSASFYANIVVSSATKPKYAVTSVEYKMVRNPADGCPANITYTAYATVTVNGPLKFTYHWNQSDGHTIRNSEVITMDAAGTTVITNSWQLHISTNPGTRWMALVIGIPIDGETTAYTEYPQVSFTKLCGG